MDESNILKIEENAKELEEQFEILVKSINGQLNEVY